MARPLRFFFLSLVSLTLLGTSPCAHAQDFSQAARRADFKTFVSDFTDNYAYLDRAEKPWTTWESRYRAAVDAAETPEAYAGVLEAALDELHDFHAEVRSRNPHRYLPVPTFADLWAEFRGDAAVVVAVRQGSDAQRAGVVPGDRITRVDDDSLAAAIAKRLTPAVDNHDARARSWALLSVLAGRSDAVRHFTLQGANGASRVIALPQERRFDRLPGALDARRLPGDFGLIRLHNSLGDEATVAAFDAALLSLKATRGLILDLRDVPSGGDSSIALGIMGRFVRTMLPYQRHRIPNYGQADIERNWIEQVAPRGPFPYDAPLVVLVDHWTGSMGEGMVVGFDAMRRATVVGTPMAHLAGAVSDFKLPQTGVDVAFATEQVYHVDGTPRQSWTPPVLVSEGATEAAREADAMLARGLAKLREQARNVRGKRSDAP